MRAHSHDIHLKPFTSAALAAPRTARMLPGGIESSREVAPDSRLRRLCLRPGRGGGPSPGRLLAASWASHVADHHRFLEHPRRAAGKERVRRRAPASPPPAVDLLGGPTGGPIEA